MASFRLAWVKSYCVSKTFSVWMNDNCFQGSIRAIPAQNSPWAVAQQWVGNQFHGVKKSSWEDCQPTTYRTGQEFWEGKLQWNRVMFVFLLILCASESRLSSNNSFLCYSLVWPSLRLVWVYSQDWKIILAVLMLKIDAHVNPNRPKQFQNGRTLKMPSAF